MKLDARNPVTRTLFLSILFAAGFTLLIAALDPLLGWVDKPADRGAWWYYWRLSRPGLPSALSAWLPYLAHQITLFVIARLFMKERPHPGSLSRLNVAALLANAGFVALHLAQTHLFYDGLAQYVPVWSSQWSVIVMLVLILYMETPRRGLFLGKGKRLVPGRGSFVNAFHGPYIAWALCYTFWFHPMEGDFGLLTGFFYMFLLFAQYSFANTEVHFSKGWIVGLESLVALHGPAIAIQKMLDPALGEPNMIWPMFASGFLFMFVFTGQFAFRWPVPARIAAFLSYGAFVGIAYRSRGYDRLYEIGFIPAALYGGALLMIGLARAWKAIRAGTGAATGASAAKQDSAADEKGPLEGSL